VKRMARMLKRALSVKMMARLWKRALEVNEMATTLGETPILKTTEWTSKRALAVKGMARLTSNRAWLVSEQPLALRGLQLVDCLGLARPLRREGKRSGVRKSRSSPRLY